VIFVELDAPEKSTDIGKKATTHAATMMIMETIIKAVV